MKKTTFKRIVSLFIAGIFALSCIIPIQTAIALMNCGPHEVVSCETHDNEHFVARHISIPSDFEESRSSDTLGDLSFPDEEHDAAHHIEESKSFISAVSVVSPKKNKILYKKHFAVAPTIITAGLQLSSWPNGPPSAKSTFLLFLPSVRLQV